jgi:hypothetical protein
MKKTKAYLLEISYSNKKHFKLIGELTHELIFEDVPLHEYPDFMLKGMWDYHKNDLLKVFNGFDDFVEKSDHIQLTGNTAFDASLLVKPIK